LSYVLDDPYPYTHAIVPEMLVEADYEDNVNLGDGVTCLRFSKSGKPVCLLYSNSGT
jgi:hypothetical protein